MVKMYQFSKYFYKCVYSENIHCFPSTPSWGIHKVALYVVGSWAAGNYNGPLTPVGFIFLCLKMKLKRERERNKEKCLILFEENRRELQAES